MRWYISYPVLAAGLAFGFQTFFPGHPDLSGPPARGALDAPPDTQTAPVVVTAAEAGGAFASRVGAFSPGAPLLDAEIASPASSSVLDYLAETLSPSGAKADPAPPAPQPITIAAWKSAVIRAPKAAVPAEPRAPISRAALARDLQRELQRVGCYSGAVDGVWGGASKRAMLLFMDRINASLPTREPDVFMLSLLRSEASPVCGASCPSGQSLTAGGRCLPSTLMAQAGRAGDAVPPFGEEAWRPTVAEATERGALPYGRMGIGGPKPDEVAEVSAGWARVTSTSSPSDPVARTAALETPAGETPAPEAGGRPNVSASSFDTDAAAEPLAAKRGAPSGYRAKAERPKRYKSSYRQVQHLFQHPLGRM